MNKVALSSAVLLSALVGCSSMPYQPYAREVKRKPGIGGEISLKVEHQDEDRAKAQALMDGNCGASRPVVEEEGEVAVGTTTTGNASETHTAGSSGSRVGTLFGMPITSGARQGSNDTATVATTTTLKEWLIAYKCDTKPVASAAPAPIAIKKSKKSAGM